MSTLDPADEPVATERQVTATTGRLAVSGRVDRVDARGDELVVVDHKTGRTPSTEDDARRSPALADHVRRAEDVADHVVAATAAHGAGDDEAFPPVPGPRCGWCDVRRTCPTGRAAAPPREPWSSLPADA